MRWHDLADQPCSLARAVSIIGDRWTLLILRDCFLRRRRFEEFQNSLGIARRVLAERLAKLVADGILKKVLYQDRPPRHEYRLTEKGLALFPVILTLVHWGDRYLATPEGPPVRHRHTRCGHSFHAELTCSECGAPLDPHEIRVEPGPGARHGTPLG